jgi:hypothetical protein
MPRFFWALHRSAPLPPQVGTLWCACPQSAGWFVAVARKRQNAAAPLLTCSLLLRTLVLAQPLRAEESAEVQHSTMHLSAVA